MLDLKAYFTSSVDNNSNNVCSVGSCTPLHPSLVTGSLLRVIYSPRKLRLQMTLVGLPVTKSGCKGVQSPQDKHYCYIKLFKFKQLRRNKDVTFHLDVVLVDECLGLIPPGPNE